MPNWQPKARPTLPASNIAVSRRGAAAEAVQQHQGPGKTHIRCKEQGEARKDWERRAAAGAAGTPRQGTGFAETPAGFRAANQTGRISSAEEKGRAAIRRELPSSAGPISAPLDSAASSRSSPGRICAKPSTGRRGTGSASRPPRRNTAQIMVTELRAERSAFATALRQSRRQRARRPGSPAPRCVPAASATRVSGTRAASSRSPAVRRPAA